METRFRLLSKALVIATAITFSSLPHEGGVSDCVILALFTMAMMGYVVVNLGSANRALYAGIAALPSVYAVVAQLRCGLLEHVPVLLTFLLWLLEDYMLAHAHTVITHSLDNDPLLNHIWTGNPSSRPSSTLSNISLSDISLSCSPLDSLPESWGSGTRAWFPDFVGQGRATRVWFPGFSDQADGEMSKVAIGGYQRARTM